MIGCGMGPPSESESLLDPELDSELESESESESSEEVSELASELVLDVSSPEDANLEGCGGTLLRDKLARVGDISGTIGAETGKETTLLAVEDEGDRVLRFL